MLGDWRGRAGGFGGGRGVMWGLVCCSWCVNLDAPSHSSLVAMATSTPEPIFLSQCSTPDKGKPPTHVFLYVNYPSLSDLAEVSVLIVGSSLEWTGL